MVRYSLAWRNPYTTPAGPRVLKAMLVPRGAPCPPEIKELWVAGGGYCISWELVSQKPIKRWSAEAKARTRRRNLRQRLEKKVPLFADIFEQEELARRPDYFAGGEVHTAST
jgi:hypothetical protein